MEGRAGIPGNLGKITVLRLSFALKPSTPSMARVPGWRTNGGFAGWATGWAWSDPGASFCLPCD